MTKITRDCRFLSPDGNKGNILEIPVFDCFRQEIKSLPWVFA
ncbi:hypothetical protein GGP73_002124 [Salinibacter ruber]|nr:hypothetical protein [Salinibacter ruber]